PQRRRLVRRSPCGGLLRRGGFGAHRRSLHPVASVVAGRTATSRSGHGREYLAPLIVPLSVEFRGGGGSGAPCRVLLARGGANICVGWSSAVPIPGAVTVGEGVSVFM